MASVGSEPKDEMDDEEDEPLFSRDSGIEVLLSIRATTGPNP
jgi:hypothetical protein